MELIRDIGQDMIFDEQTLTLAIYLHDWGALPLYYEKGIDHALRSRQVVVCYRRILARRTGIEGRFSLPRAQKITQTRLERMNQCLDWRQEESFEML
jgi:hypothetical protein